MIRMLGRNTESRQIISTNLHSCCGLRLFLLLEPVPLAETDVRGGDPVRELDPNTQLCPAHSLHHLRSVHSHTETVAIFILDLFQEFASFSIPLSIPSFIPLCHFASDEDLEI